MKKTTVNLVPNTINTSPDYYCTWQTQLYATCDGKPEKQRAIIGEKALFDDQKPYGWAYFYEKARKDLFFVMDDSWDVPPNNNSAFYGSLILNSEKFPESTRNAKTNAQALKQLTKRIKSLGWKGLGGWVCAQKSEIFANINSEKYWTERLTDAKKSDFSYWKVDWGKNSKDITFRKMLSDLGKQIAPELIIEHSLIKDIIPYSDVYRTYDVPAIMSIPMTMEKIREFAALSDVTDGFHGLINCEDEAYIAAAGGFTMGIMRHPYAGAFINGKPDMSFPQIHRNLKTKMYEVIRAVQWHKIAPAFGVNCRNICVDDTLLHDTWKFINTNEEIEEWWLNMPIFKEFIHNDIVTKSAPARISRNCSLPEVTPDASGTVPYVISAENPNGAFSVATLGRTLGREYFIPKCDISVNIGNSKIVAAFGEYKSLTLKTTSSDIKSVLMQDLADNVAYDITNLVNFEKNKIVIPGDIISKIGTISQPDTDTSEPGVVIAF